MMGRRKGTQKLELIANKKSRKLTFNRRKEGLVKKIKELTTLCDVDACMIIYAPDHDGSIVWPPNNPSDIHRMIHLYRAKNVQDLVKKTCGVQDFYSKKTCNLKTVELLDLEQLKQFRVVLQDKAHLIKSRIDQLRKKELIMDCSSSFMLFSNNNDDANLDDQDSAPAMMMPCEMMMDDDNVNNCSVTATPFDDQDCYAATGLYGIHEDDDYDWASAGGGSNNDDDANLDGQDLSPAMMLPGEMMMNDDRVNNSSITATTIDDQNCYATTGLYGIHEYDDYDWASAGVGILGQLYTPPRPQMMMWQTDNDIMPTSVQAEVQDDFFDDISQYLIFD